MRVAQLPDLARRLFRTSESYDLVVFDRLSIEEQELLAELRTDPDCYGVLRPRAETGRTYRAIGKDAALLLLTMRDPGLLPFFVWSGDVAGAAKAVGDLVLDGVLEIEQGGQFISGSAAAALFSQPPTVGPTGRLAEMSRDALLYGQALQLDDPDLLSNRLYAYGRCPVTPEWSFKLRDDDATLACIGAKLGTRARDALDRDWRLDDHPDAAGWFAWRNPRYRSYRAGSGVYKLYVSPHLADIANAFPVVVDLLSRRAVLQFKLGRSAEGLLRPDKLIVYFDTLDHLLETANDLGHALMGIAPHGVPFTAEITHDGLLSWGMDPPPAGRLLAWQAPESWRLWVVRRLANAMIAAQSSTDVAMPPWQFAVERLQREGVDTQTWIPSASIWSSGA